MGKTMNSKERRWIILFGLIVASLTTVPYLLGFGSQGQEWVFTGFVYGIEDGNSYIAKMLQGSAGAWFFRSPYSSLPQQGVVAYLPYILLGKLAAGSAIHLQLVVLYHLFRIIAAFISILATYQFISLFVKQVYWRKWATIIVTVGGGVGWFLILIGESNWLGSLPLEWYSPEWFGFLSYYGHPHLLLARGLLLFGLTFYLSAPARAKRGWYAGGVFFLLGLVHPLSLVSAAAVIGAHQISVWMLALKEKAWPNARRWFTAAFQSLLIPSPLVLYTGYKFLTDPFLKLWTDQNRILSPHPAHILIAYGMMLIPALYGVRHLLRTRKWTGTLLLAWVIILPLLAYAPHNLQRRFPEGVWVAIATVASIGFLNSFRADTKRRKRFGIAMLVLSIPSSIFLIFGGIQVSLNPDLPIFRTVEEVGVFEWLNEHGDPGQMVLSSYETGNAIPAWTPSFVVIGHGPESANLVEFRVQVSAFYSGRLSRGEQLEFIEKQGIDNVFFGPAERELGDIDLNDYDYLKRVFQSGQYEIYEVIQSSGVSP